MIMHLDLDCFFVSAHRIYDESLLNIPVAVGGRSNLSIFDINYQANNISPNSGAFVSNILSNSNQNFQQYFKDSNGKIRGIITTCSYEARAYGVKTAMSVSEALSLCPSLKVIPPNYVLYHELSLALKNYLETKSPHVEQYSIDEFFVDFKGIIKDKHSHAYALYLKQNIYENLKLPISIGIAKSKYLSKLATKDAKPYGVKIVNENEIEEYIKDKHISEFPGIGKGFEKKLLANGIRKLGQIKEKKDLFYSWKKPGIQLYNKILGIDDNKVEANTQEKKSIGMARSFDPIFSRDEIKRRITILCKYISFLIYKQKVNPQTYFLKIRYEYKSKTKEYFNTNRLFSEQFFLNIILDIFSKIDIHPSHKIIQLNISVSNFNNKKSYDIFEYEKDLKKSNLTMSINNLRQKYGINIIRSAKEISNLNNKT